jgi:hypothetical protein
MGWNVGAGLTLGWIEAIQTLAAAKSHVPRSFVKSESDTSKSSVRINYLFSIADAQTGDFSTP